MILSGAAVGVVVTRTREPFRAMDALREYSFAKERQFKSWTMLAGWATYDRHDPNIDPTVDNMADPLAALKAINAVGGGTPFFVERRGEVEERVGICCMMWSRKAAFWKWQASCN